MVDSLDAVDRRIINTLQEGLPICERPYEVAGRVLGLAEAELISRLRRLLERGVLSRFGPMYRIEQGGGAVTLAAMAVTEQEVDRVAALLNAQPEVAHNYARAHDFNLWFVLATASPVELVEVVGRLEQLTGHPVILMPKEREYFLDLRLEV